MGVARVASRAQLGLSAPRVEVEVHLGQRIAHVLDRRVARHRGEGEQGSRARRARRTPASNFPPVASPSISRPRICPRKAAATILPIALGILLASAQLEVSEQRLATSEFYGELGLAGELKPVKGVLLAAAHAAREGRHVVVPAANLPRRASPRQVGARGADTLLGVCALVRGNAFDARWR